MENFIGKVIKIVSGDKGGSKDNLIDDSKSKPRVCYECEFAFGQFDRRINCQICERVFCGNCTRISILTPRESTNQKWLRVCNYCYRVRQRSDQPAVRVHHHHAGSRGSGNPALSHPDNSRPPLDVGPQTGPASGDGGYALLAAGRTRRGAASGRWPRYQSSVHRVSSGDLSWAVPPPLEDDFGMSLTDRDARLLYKQQLDAGVLPPDAPPQANSLADVHRQLFSAASEAHLRAVVQQLLMVELVPQPETWAPIVSGAAQAVAVYLSPTQMFANGQHDPRQSLKVKKVADVRRPENTCVVTGVVVRKGLVHRKMRSYIEYPKVLLLAGSLEYQRETNKLSSFDLMDHDKEYLSNAVARLSVVKPDVLLVEGSVARMAQENLQLRNISVAQTIKIKVLERLARAMGVRVTPTVEHLTPATAHLYLGDCKVFRVETENINVPATATTGMARTATPAIPAGAESVLAANEGPPAAAAPAATRTTWSPTSDGMKGGPMPPEAPQPWTADPAAQREAQQQTPVEPSQEAAAERSATGVAATRAPTVPAPEGTICPKEVPASEPASSVSPRPVAEEHQAKYTSLSAAMMMKALGSGPNAAAAVACVSGGSGVSGSALPFRSWASSSSTVCAQAPLQPAPSVVPSISGGQGGRVATASGERSSAPLSAAVTTGPLSAPGRTALVPVPAGPPAPPQVTLMYFEGCRPTTCTVLLKGAGLELLKKLKPVVGFAVLTAWNQRLESSFLSDLLTTSVASAGEEAYLSWAGATNSTVASFPTSASNVLAASSFAHSAPTLSGASSVSPTSYSSPLLSLGFFRLHGEQAIRTSMAAASAFGVPGILLSISPHCNAWDESLIAEWEQQGFTFPHHHHHHHHHYRYQGLIENKYHQPLLTAAASSPQVQQQQQQPKPAAETAALPPEDDKGSAFQSGSMAVTTPQAAATLTMSGLAGNESKGDVLLQELSLAIVPEGDGVGELLRTEQKADASGDESRQQADDAAAQAAEPNKDYLVVGSAPPDFMLSTCASTMRSPFAPAAAVVVPATASVAALPGSGPQLEASSTLCGQATGQATEAHGSAAGLPRPPVTSGLNTSGHGDGPGDQTVAGATEVAGSAVDATQEAGAGAGEISGSAAARPPGGVSASAPSEAGVDAPLPPPPPAAPEPICQGAQDEQQQRRQQPSPAHAQQQSAVMVLQGQRIYSHQRIFVTCMFRRSRDRNLCDPFQVKQIDYYHRSSDVPLIRYIKMCTQLGWTCPGLGCPEPFTAHESVFFFGHHKLTIFYSMLPPVQALPGEEKNQIWHWTRPIGRGREGAASCRRVPLSQDACYISMGRFLELSFSADGLAVFGRSLHYDHVRYFGLGRTLVCMFPERTNVYVMQLPEVVMSYSQQAQDKWLRQESFELVQEGNDAFNRIKRMLAESPHFSGSGASTSPGSWEMAAPSQTIAAAGDGASADVIAASASFTPGTSPSNSTDVLSFTTSRSVSPLLRTMLLAACKDHQCFLALVDTCMRQCAPDAHQQGSQSTVGNVPWDEQIIYGLRELNRLRSVLSKNVLQWASRLQDPAGFTAHYSRLTSGGGGAGNSGYKSLPASQLQPQPLTLTQHPQPQSQPPAQAPPSSSPRGSASIPFPSPITGPEPGGLAASSAAPAAAQLPQSMLDIVASEGSLSLFGAISPAVAAYRLSMLAGQPSAAGLPPSENSSFTSMVASEVTTEQRQHQTADTTAAHALPIPIIPHTHGPLSVYAVAEMVAQQEHGDGGELLEGSRWLLRTLGALPTSAATAASAAAMHIAGGRPGHSRGASRSDLPAAPVAAPTASTSSSAGAAVEGAVAGGLPVSLGQDDGFAAAAPSGRSTLQPPIAGLGASCASLKRLSSTGRLSTGGSAISGLNAAVAAATTIVGPAGGAQPQVQGGGGGLRGTSLPRSTSVSTVGDLGDLSYMGGIGGDSGGEDADDGEEGREEQDDEEPDHDTFIAFMGSAPRGPSVLQSGAGPSGPGRSATEGRSAAGGSRVIASGDLGDDVADEVGDGAYYYRALFSHGVGYGEEAILQPLHQPPQPQVQQHLLQPRDEEQGQKPQSAAQLQPVTISLGSAPQTASVGISAAPSPRSAGLGTIQMPAGTGPLPLVPGVEVLNAAAVTTVFPRRQLTVQVRRQLDAVATATAGGGSMARGSIPLPGRATLPPGVNDIIIPIFEGEPTSIIAYALSTRAYHQQINAGYKVIFSKARTENNRERDREPASVQVTQASVIPPTILEPSQLQQQQQQQQQQLTSTGTLSRTLTASALTVGVSAGAFGPAQSFNGAMAGGILATGTASLPAPSTKGALPFSVPVMASSSSSTGAAPTITQAPSAPMNSSLPLPAPLPPSLSPMGPIGANPDGEWWTVLTSKEACHVRVVFDDEARSMPWARARFTVTAPFAPQFAELRRRCIQGGEAAFVASMCRCKRWESRGGKSNAYFAKSRDDRYIIKSLSKSEKASFMNFAPHYFTHMCRHLLNRDAPTCLSKILGVYSVAFKPQPGTTGLEGAVGGGPAGAATSAARVKELKDREFSQDLLVMENCFYDRPVVRIYDLKGSERNRFNADAASRPEDQLEVHLDDNLRRTMHTNPIFVDARSRHLMEAAMWADTTFLAGQDVMDYSLLVGVDKENGVLALAIIDFIRQYTWDKQLETWVKSSGMLGGNGKEPTIISPKQYMRRFRAAMQQYFTPVPGSAGSEVPKDPDAVV